MFELRCLSLFANVGIAEAYFKEIGVKVVIANEIIKERAKFYQEVYPETHMICGDITDEQIRTLIVDESINKKVNFIIATPPCQGMSVAGNRDDKDPRNQLIYYAIDVVKRVNPDFVMLENVPRQLTTKIRVGEHIIKIPDYIRQELGNQYRFNSETLAKAKDFSVPQIRERNIFLLTKKSLNVEWEFPAKQPEITLEEAIGTLPSLDPQLREGLKLTHEKFPDYEEKKAAGLAVSKWHHPPIHPWRQVEWMMHTPSGKSAIYNEKYYPQKPDGTRIKAHHNNYRRMAWEKPSRTITQNNGVISSLACVHPGRPYQENGETLYSDPRVLSLYEVMIVSSLPLDWPIPEWADENLVRNVIGEGIPSKLIKVIVEHLISKL